MVAVCTGADRNNTGQNFGIYKIYRVHY